METNRILYPGAGAREASARRRKGLPIFAWAMAGALLLIIGVLACLHKPPLAASAGRPADGIEPFRRWEPRAGYKETVRPSGFYPAQEASDIQAVILDAAARHDMDGALILAIVMAESGYDPLAVSEKGAAGLMQLMPATAEALGVRDIFDPAQNIDGGVRHFKALLNQFRGDITLALAAYNAGSWHVEKYSGVPPFKTTQRFVECVLEHYREFRRQLGSAPDQV